MSKVRYMAMLAYGNTFAIETNRFSDRFTVFCPKPVAPEVYAFLGDPSNGYLQSFKLWQQGIEEPLTWDTYAKYGVARPATVVDTAVASASDMERQIQQQLDMQRRAEAARSGMSNVPGVDEALAEAERLRQAELKEATANLSTGLDEDEMAMLDESSYDADPPTPDKKKPRKTKVLTTNEPDTTTIDAEAVVVPDFGEDSAN